MFDPYQVSSGIILVTLMVVFTVLRGREDLKTKLVPRLLRAVLMMAALITTLMCVVMAIFARSISIQWKEQGMHWLGAILYTAGIVPTVLAAVLVILGCPYIMFKSAKDIDVMTQALYLPQLAGSFRRNISALFEGEPKDDDWKA